MNRTPYCIDIYLNLSNYDLSNYVRLTLASLTKQEGIPTHTVDSFKQRSLLRSQQHNILQYSEDAWPNFCEELVSVSKMPCKLLLLVKWFCGRGNHKT